MRNPRIDKWCNKYLKLVVRNHIPIYPLWERVWCLPGQHLLVRLRVMGSDFGADIIIASCSASYGAEEDDWRCVNMGHWTSLKHIKGYYRLLSGCTEDEG